MALKISAKRWIWVSNELEIKPRFALIKDKEQKELSFLIMDH